MSAGFDFAALSAAVAAEGAVVRVVVAGAAGSVPRAAGTAMLVRPGGQSGTIGGGALEYEAVRIARRLVGAGGPWARELRHIALGPALGQCCGGRVTLLFERFGAAEIAEVARRASLGVFARPCAGGVPPDEDLATGRARRAVRAGQGAPFGLDAGVLIEPFTEAARPVWLYGAGHVGRAIVRVAEDLPVAITWVDTARDRYPEVIPAHAAPLVARDPARAVAHAPDDATHLVLTYSHAMDLDICHAVLSRRFGHLGLIGSASKRARFLARLRALGHSEATLGGLQCPIGDRALGKRPAAIALGVMAEIMRRADAFAPAGRRSA